MTRLRLLLLLIAAGCAGTPRPSAPPAPTPPVRPAPKPAAPPVAQPQRAVDLPVQTVRWEALDGWADADHAAARAGFISSCKALERREDGTGLTRPADWARACAAARAGGPARGFFETHFRAVRVSGGEGFATGYFEPELRGSRTRSAEYPHPLYRLPPDLIELDLGRVAESLKGKRNRGRMEGRAFAPYPDRAAIEGGALSGRGLELAWAADPYELFFLHIQGSGRLRLADGQVMRVGYAGQNGRDYVAIGRTLRDRGALASGQATMDGIIGWMRARPDEGRALMHMNGSYVFFRELTGPGPVGSLNVPLQPEGAVAVDPRFVPLGAPVFLATRTSEGRWAKLVVAQDTGGAIKGANRFDIFFGPGERARRLAGGQAGEAEATILLPVAAAERLSGAQS